CNDPAEPGLDVLRTRSTLDAPGRARCDLAGQNYRPDIAHICGGFRAGCACLVVCIPEALATGARLARRRGRLPDRFHTGNTLAHLLSPGFWHRGGAGGDRGGADGAAVLGIAL